jgi:hypothetical protein
MTTTAQAVHKAIEGDPTAGSRRAPAAKFAVVSRKWQMVISCAPNRGATCEYCAHVERMSLEVSNV